MMHVTSVQAFNTLGPGKHLSFRITLSGTVAPESVRSVSKRLFFFCLHYVDHEGSRQSQECLVKWRDGCFEEDEIASLMSNLAKVAPAAESGADPTALTIHAFPEIGDDRALASLHVIHASLPVQLLQIPSTPRDPVPDRAPTRTVQYKTAGNHRRPNTESRHQQFVAWLVETYGLECLKAGSGVLDVAGGAGGVAFELAFRRGIPCVVVDPRPMQLNARQRRAIRNRVNSQAALGSRPPPNASWWLGAAGTSATDEPVPSAGHAIVCEEIIDEEAAGEPPVADAAMPREAVDAVSEAATVATQEAESTAPPPAIPASYAAAWVEEGLPLGCVPRQIVGCFDEAFASGPYAPLWKSCSVVVGMHPDQATEPIVRLALADGKPFAVVPCCVFANTNPQRRLSDGRCVRSHAEFCDYLEDLGQRAGPDGASGEAEGGGDEDAHAPGEVIHTRVAPTSRGQQEVRRTDLSCLAFEGRNTVVYSADTV